MVKLVANSRMNAYCDIWALSRDFKFDGTQLRDGIRAAFRRRTTALSADFAVALSREFSGNDSELRQWAAFIKRGQLRIAEGDWETVVETFRDFLGPAVSAAAFGSPLKLDWPKGVPWNA